jgi:cholesterol oxidase
MPEILQHLGVRDLTVLTRADNWPDNLLDEALRVYPVGHDEGCGNALCHRATFLYGLLYEHAQLGEQLHANLQELFGVHDVELFSQLAAMVRERHVVDAHGANVYLPNLEGMNLPIGFIHGAENRCYLPVSTETTYNMLVERFGAQQYERHLIQGYGHIDCIFGKNAAVDVYPVIARYLDAH